MSYAKEESAGVAGPADCQLIRWRAWPCASCRGGAAAEDFLVRCFSSSPDLPEGEGNELIDWFKKWEAARLLEWIGGCEHTLWEEMRLPRLAEGSEHLVLLDETGGEVVKVTLPGTYQPVEKTRFSPHR